MPKVIQFVEGNGIADDAYNLTIQIPDGNAGSARIEGTVTAMGLQQVQVAVSSTTLPGAPGSGFIYFNLQLDPTTGAVTLYQSTSAQPAAVLAADNVHYCRVIYNDVLSPTSTDPAYDSGATPSSPAGGP